MELPSLHTGLGATLERDKYKENPNPVGVKKEQGRELKNEAVYLTENRPRRNPYPRINLQIQNIIKQYLLPTRMREKQIPTYFSPYLTKMLMIKCITQSLLINTG